MATFTYYIKTSACESRGSIVAADAAAAETLVRNEFTKTYKVGASNVTPTVTTVTITATS